MISPTPKRRIKLIIAFELITGNGGWYQQVRRRLDEIADSRGALYEQFSSGHPRETRTSHLYRRRTIDAAAFRRRGGSWAVSRPNTSSNRYRAVGRSRPLVFRPSRSKTQGCRSCAPTR